MTKGAYAAVHAASRRETETFWAKAAENRDPIKTPATIEDVAVLSEVEDALRGIGYASGSTIPASNPAAADIVQLADTTKVDPKS